MKLIVLKNNVLVSDTSVDTGDISEEYEIYVGRSEDCHIKIDDPLVSRHHFVIKNNKSDWFIEKISQLGTIIVSGISVSKNSIKPGDEIKFGGYSVIVSDFQTTESFVAKNPQETDFKAYDKPLSQENVPSVVQSEPSLKDISTNQLYENDLVTEENILPQNEDLNDLNEDLTSMESFEDLEAIENQGHLETVNEDSVQEIEQFPDLDSVNEYEDKTTDENSYEVSLKESDEGTKFLKAFVNYQLVLFGEHAPYDRFQIDQDEVFIGRESKKCQIILNDPEVSSVHAVIRKKNTEISIEDLNSSNGTIINGERINKAILTAGDEFVIGGTSFTLEIKSDLLDSEADRLMPVESGQVIETEEVLEEELSGDTEEGISFENEGVPEKSIIKRIWKDPAKRKKAIYIVAAIVLGWVLLSPEEPKPVATKEKPSQVEAKPTINDNKNKINLSKELETSRNTAYELGVSYFEQTKYFEALREFQIVTQIDPNYKKVQSYLEQTKIGLKRLEDLEAQKRAEEDRIKNKKLVEELLVKAREAVKERNIVAAEASFSQIIEKDPENIEVSQLKLELEAWQKEEEKKALERAAKEADRKRMVDSFLPAKTFYLKKEWYKAILKLEEFLRIKNLDEDLVKEASDMMSDSKNQLSSDLGPLLGKARSLKEGQDLKNSYEAYLEVLKVEPTNSEALNEVDEIKLHLESRSKKIYREGIIAESLSLFVDAKEKFQEVQQISPTDSDYYKKATEKLKNYLE